MNIQRRAEQDKIFEAADQQAFSYTNDKVLVLSDPTWSHGIIGIVAAKLLEKHHKPTFVLQELGDGTAKGSARSFGGFSAVAAIRATDGWLIKGGGHKLAAGVTLQIENISTWRRAINAYYRQLNLRGQEKYFLPTEEVVVSSLVDLDEKLWNQLMSLEPYGNGNPEPIFRVRGVGVSSRRVMGDNSQHVKYTFSDGMASFQTVAWNRAVDYVFDVGDEVDVWFTLTLNEWRGRRSVEGRLVRLEPSLSI
jgi:single-stranded-DNA-specific exonuclease